MHPALQIYDIIECICQHLRTTNSLDTLAKLARTCSTFLDPALNSLWHTIPSLEPLARCLPQDAWAVRTTMYHHPVLTLKRNTTPQDWERCKFYAHRIRHYGIDDINKLDDMKGATQTDKTFYIALKSPTDLDCDINAPAPISEPLLSLPNLHSCRLLPYSSDPIPHYSPFLSPMLTSLFLRIPSPLYVGDTMIIGLLRSLPTASPDLRNLTLYGTVIDSTHHSVGCRSEAVSREGDEINELLTNVLHGLQHLESLHCPYIWFPVEAVRYLAGEMKLRSLNIKNSGESIQDALSYDAAQAQEKENTWFEYLEELIVECSPRGGLSEAVSLLKRVGNISKLTSLDVARTGGIPTETETRSFIQALADLTITAPPIGLPSFNKRPILWVNHHLKNLHIHQGDETGFLTHPQRPTPVTKYTITISTLSPLLSFPDLSELGIMVGMRFSLDDGDAQQMARAWPKLKQLELGYCGGGWGREGKTFTLEGLKAFAKHCPGLEDLAVSVNVGAVEPVVEQSEQQGGHEKSLNSENGETRDSHCCQKLRNLDLGDSVYSGEPECVARSLLDIFPKLSRVCGPSIAISSEWEKKWMQVSKIVCEMQGSVSVSAAEAADSCCH